MSSYVMIVGLCIIYVFEFISHDKDKKKIKEYEKMLGINKNNKKENKKDDNNFNDFDF